MHKGAFYDMFSFFRDLSQNELEDLPQNAFEKNTNLTYLHLDMNNLTAIRQNHFKGLANLEFLLLTSNQISEIELGMHAFFFFCIVLTWPSFILYSFLTFPAGF